MLQAEPIRPEVPKAIRYMVIAGFYVFLSAWFIATSRKGQHTLVYAFFLAPTAFHLFICMWKQDPTLKALLSPIYLLLGAFLSYMTVTSAWSDNAEDLSDYIKRIVYTMIFVYGVHVVVRYEAAHFWRAILCAIALCIPWLAINLIYYPEEAFASDRLIGVHAGVNYLLTGAMLGSLFVLGVCSLIQRLAQQGFSIANLVVMLGIVVVFYGLLLTESRSALLALVATAAYWAVSSKEIRQFKLLALLALPVIGVMLAPYAELFISRGFSQRFEIWAIALEWIGQRPWLGHGMDALFVINVSSGEELYDPHNIHLKVLYDGGVIGGALWLAVLCAIGWRAWQHRDTPMAQCVMALLIYSVSVKFFESRGILTRPTEFWHLVWLCAGMALACHSKVDASMHSYAPAPDTKSVE